MGKRSDRKAVQAMVDGVSARLTAAHGLTYELAEALGNPDTSQRAALHKRIMENLRAAALEVERLREQYAPRENDRRDGPTILEASLNVNVFTVQLVASNMIVDAMALLGVIDDVQDETFLRSAIEMGMSVYESQAEMSGSLRRSSGDGPRLYAISQVIKASDRDPQGPRKAFEQHVTRFEGVKERILHIRKGG